MRVATLLLVLVLAAPAVALEVAPSPGCKAAKIDPGRPIQGSIDVDGTARSYLLDVPQSVTAGTPAPLLLDFHGFNHSAAGVWKVSGFRALAAKDGFITVYPDGIEVALRFDGKSHRGRGWEISSLGDNRDLAFVTALLGRLEREYCVDRSRIYATGFSNGAFFSSLLGCAMADRFAAVAPVSGGPLAIPCDPSRGVPVLIHHGRQDVVIPVDRAREALQQWTTANRCAGKIEMGVKTGTHCDQFVECRDSAVVQYCEGGFAHRWPPEATARIWTFFRAHRLITPD